MRFDSIILRGDLVPKWLVRVGALLVVAGTPALFGQQCFPPQGRASAGTMVATVMFRGGGLTVQSRGEIFDLDPAKGKRDAFVTFREGDVVEFAYSGLLVCRGDNYTATVLQITKKGTSPPPTVSPSGLRAITAVLTGKQEIRNDSARPDSRQISVDADRGKYGNCDWSFAVSLDDHLFPTLMKGDMLRITYFDAAPPSAGGYCFASVWRMNLAVLDSLHTFETAEITYASIYIRGFSSDLTSLGGGCPQPSENCAGLVEDALAGGLSGGYRFTYAAGGPDASGRVNKFEIFADPLHAGEAGVRHYFMDDSGVIRWESGRRAGPNSPPI